MAGTMAYPSVGCKLPLEGLQRNAQRELWYSFHADSPSDSSKRMASEWTSRSFVGIVPGLETSPKGTFTASARSGNSTSWAPVYVRNGLGCFVQSRWPADAA